MATGHVRWERTGADEHAAAYEEARASLLLVSWCTTGESSSASPRLSWRSERA